MPQRDYELPAQSLDAADRLVALANEIGPERSHDSVRAVMMYASAPYNAFCWLTADAARTVDEAANDCAGEYRTMFGEHVGELRPVDQRDAPTGPPQ